LHDFTSRTPASRTGGVQLWDADEHMSAVLKGHKHDRNSETSVDPGWVAALTAGTCGPRLAQSRHGPAAMHMMLDGDASPAAIDAQVDAMLKEMVPLTGLEPVTPALRTQATRL